MDAPYRGDMKVAPSMGAWIETPATPSPPPSTAERDPAGSVIVPLDVISIHAPQAGRDTPSALPPDQSTLPDRNTIHLQ